jgi:hypothetical protein
MKKRARIMLAGMFAFTLLGAFLAFKAPQGQRVFTWNEANNTCELLTDHTITLPNDPDAFTSQASTTTDFCRDVTYIKVEG